MVFYQANIILSIVEYKGVLKSARSLKMKQNRKRKLVRWLKEQEIRLGAKVDVREFWTGQRKQVVHCKVGE